jgi:hypothetical protein
MMLRRCTALSCSAASMVPECRRVRHGGRPVMSIGRAHRSRGAVLPTGPHPCDVVSMARFVLMRTEGTEPQLIRETALPLEKDLHDVLTQHPDRAIGLAQASGGRSDDL